MVIIDYIGYTVIPLILPSSILSSGDLSYYFYYNPESLQPFMMLVTQFSGITHSASPCSPAKTAALADQCIPLLKCLPLEQFMKWG